MTGMIDFSDETPDPYAAVRDAIRLVRGKDDICLPRVLNDLRRVGVDVFFSEWMPDLFEYMERLERGGIEPPKGKAPIAVLRAQASTELFRRYLNGLIGST